MVRERTEVALVKKMAAVEAKSERRDIRIAGEMECAMAVLWICRALDFGCPKFAPGTIRLAARANLLSIASRADLFRRVRGRLGHLGVRSQRHGDH
jgi:hypothetical protein